MSHSKLARLFGVRLVSDIYEKVCEAGITPPLDAKRRGRLARIRAKGVLFIHVPKTAGMSISMALYGRQMKHASMRYYAKVAPALVEALPSFAILRDPVERFLSAYHYARAGGSRDNRIAPPFRARYMALRSVEEAMDHVEGATNLYELDHVFRPQARYITDRAGRIAVDRLILMDDLAAIAEVAPGWSPSALPRMNRSQPSKASLAPAEAQRLRNLYPWDFMLFESLKAGRAPYAAPA